MASFFSTAETLALATLVVVGAVAVAVPRWDEVETQVADVSIVETNEAAIEGNAALGVAPTDGNTIPENIEGAEVPTPDPEIAAQPELEAELEPSAEPVVLAEDATTSEPEIAAIPEITRGDAASADLTEPEIAQTPVGLAPVLDVVRVDASGRYVIAGQSLPDAKINLSREGSTVSSVIADANGQFVALFNDPVPGAGTTLNVTAERDGFAASVPVFVLPNVEASTPAIVELDGDEQTVKIEPSGDIPTLNLGSVSYGDNGTVILSGLASVGATVSALVNGQEAGIAVAADDGAWSIDIGEIPQNVFDLAIMADDENGMRLSDISRSVTLDGRATLEAAQVAPAVQVAETAETAEVVAAASEEKSPGNSGSLEPETISAAGQKRYTVQRGDFLWRIAVQSFGAGEGMRYHDIYNVNGDLIKNPDLIYPGQEFLIPALQDPVSEVVPQN